MLNFSKLGYTPLLILDDGHGPETAGKRTPAFLDGTVIRENTFNKAVINLLEADAQRLGFKTYLTAPEDTDIPLQARTDRANKAWNDYIAQLKAQGVKIDNPKKVALFYSQHFNAMSNNWEGSDAEGVFTFYYTGSEEGKRLADCIHKYLIQGTPQKNGGTRAAGFHVLKYTGMYAVLGEAGFMDDPREAALMTSPVFQKETATQVLQGICEYYGLVYEAEQPKVTGTPIVGKPSATVEQAQAWARKRGASEQFIRNAPIFWGLAAACGGVDPAGAYVQSAKETNYGNFGGVINESFCNPCGMKKKAGGGNYDPEAHQRFSNWSTGIAAQMDHLALYAGAEGYPKAATVDPRHFPHIKGTAPTWEALGGKWAPSATYGNSIVALLRELQKTEAPKEPTPQEIAVDAALAAGIITNRDYWLKVLNGDLPVNRADVIQAFTNAKGLKRG